MPDVLIGLGSNLADRKTLIDEAITRLGLLPKTRVVARSSYYRTEPVGPVEQEWFINAAVRLITESDAEALATACREIEAALGRDRSVEVPSGPRFIDIDVIAARGEEAKAEDYDLRHARFIEHAFALVPLAEIVPNARLDGRTVAEHLSDIDQSGVERLDWPVPEIPAP